MTKSSINEGWITKKGNYPRKVTYKQRLGFSIYAYGKNSYSYPVSKNAVKKRIKYLKKNGNYVPKYYKGKRYW